jgi:hypothetical protein
MRALDSPSHSLIRTPHLVRIDGLAGHFPASPFSPFSASLPMATLRAPYQGAKRRLVAAFDLGTTFSGISYSILDPQKVPETNTVTRFDPILVREADTYRTLGILGRKRAIQRYRP